MRCPGPEPARGWPGAAGRGPGGVASAQREGGWRRGQHRVKGGAGTTHARSLLSPATRVSLALKSMLEQDGRRGACIPARAPRVGPPPPSPWPRRTHSTRTHLGHSHSSSRDMRPERAHPLHTLTHAWSHARAHTQPPQLLPNSTPTRAPQRRPLTVTHLHSFTDTLPHASQPDTHSQTGPRSTHAPPRCLLSL